MTDEAAVGLRALLAERVALADAHAVLQACHAVIDPEDHPALAARIAAILAPCDVAGVCPTLPPAPIDSPAGRDG